MPLRLMGIYAPTVQRPDIEKDCFYEKPGQLTHKYSRKGPTSIFENFIARLETSRVGEEAV
eukprot:7931593-Prorocentrum_lima.AAC.1